MRKKRVLHWLSSLAVGFSAVVAFGALGEYSYHTIFFARDLSRAEGILSGHAIFFGPEVTGGGSLPGPLFYYLLAFALRLGSIFHIGNWHVAWLELAVFTGTVYGMLWHLLRKWLGMEAAFLGTGLLISLPWSTRIPIESMNSSWLPLFALCALLAVGRAFSGRGLGAHRAWYAACLATGLGIQLQFGVAFLLAAGIVLQFFARPLRVERLPLKYFARGLGVFFLPLAPYIAWRIAAYQGFSVGQPAPPSAGSYGEMYASFRNALSQFGGRWAGPGAGMGPRALFREGHFQHVSLTIGAVLLVVGAIAFWRGEKGDPELPREGIDLNKLRRAWFVCLAFGLVPLFGVFPYLYRTRYFIDFYLSLVLVIAVSVRLRLGKGVAADGAWRAVCAVLLLLPAIAALWTGFHFRSNLAPFLIGLGGAGVAIAAAGFFMRREAARTINLTLGLCALGFINTTGRRDLDRYSPVGFAAGGLEAASHEIYQRTHWTVDQLAEKFFLVNVHYEVSPLVAYADVSRETASNAPLGEAIDGFFFVNARTHPGFSAQLARKTLLDGKLEESLREAILTGAIEIGVPSTFRHGFVAPYRVRDPLRAPLHFQNLGVSFSPGRPNASPLAARIEKIALRQCPSRAAKCEVVVLLWRTKKGTVHVRIEGLPVEAPSPWMAPDWSQGFENPYVKFQCANGTAPHVKLAANVGYLPESEQNLSVSGTILGPFERELSDPCPGGGTWAAFGYEKSTVFSGSRELVLPASEFEKPSPPVEIESRKRKTP